MEDQMTLMAKVALTVVCVNIALSAAKQILEKIKDRTSTDLDNRAHAIVSRVTEVTSKVVDWLSANTPH